MGKRGDHTAHQVEDEELDMPKAVLNIIPKDDEIEHVAQQVHPTAVHEHGGKNRYKETTRILRKIGRSECPGIDEFISTRHLNEENDEVEDHQRPGDHGNYSAVGIVISDG